jgi:sec-independent protein translocase protein TatA
MPNIGPTELIIVLVIALVVLGPKKLPAVARSVGEGLAEFKGALTHSVDSRPSGDERVGGDDSSTT